MATNSQRPKGQGSALSSLDKAISDLNLAKKTVGVPPAKAALDSASILLETVRESRADKPRYLELGLSYATVCEALSRGVSRKQADSLSQPVLTAIEQLTMTAVEIHQKIIKQDKQNVFSRALNFNKDKEINTWLSDLIKILHVFNTELGPNAPVTPSDTPHDLPDAQTPTPEAPTETVVPAAPNTPKTDVAGGKVPDDPAGTHKIERQDAHNDKDRTDPNQGTPYEASRTFDPVRNHKATGGPDLVRENGRDMHSAMPHDFTQRFLRGQANLRGGTGTQVPSAFGGGGQFGLGLGLPTTIGGTGGLPFPPEPSRPRGNSNSGRETGSTNTDGWGGEVTALQELVDDWTRQRAIHAASGGDISGLEEGYKAAIDFLALLKSYPGGPTTDFEAFQVKKAREDFFALVRPDDDEQLNRAIAESLAMAPAAEEAEEEEDIPPEALLCVDDRPVVIRTPNPKLAPVGQLWQALCHVPQVQHQISQYCKLSPPEDATGADHSVDETEEQVWAVHELFEFMESAGLAVVTGEPSMEQFPHRPWQGISPREDVESAYKDFTERVEVCLNDRIATQHPNWPRLFHSRINDGTSQERAAFNAKNDFSFISVEYNDEDGSSDLVGCLTNRGFPKFKKQQSLSRDRATTGERATIEAADVIAFALAREYKASSSHRDSTTGITQERTKFSFPESFYLDRFAMSNRGLILEAKVVEDVERSIASGSSTRGPQPEKYDLRAVLMHDGQRGRTHVYSYIKKDDVWWKTVDYTVTQVPLEEVLSDKNGLHLEAGPFFLIYSCSSSRPPPSEPPETSASCKQSTSDSNPAPPEPDSESLYAG